MSRTAHAGNLALIKGRGIVVGEAVIDAAFSGDAGYTAAQNAMSFYWFAPRIPPGLGGQFAIATIYLPEPVSGGHDCHVIATADNGNLALGWDTTTAGLGWTNTTYGGDSSTDRARCRCLEQIVSANVVYLLSDFSGADITNVSLYLKMLGAI
jgi:hypothetical protein